MGPRLWRNRVAPRRTEKAWEAKRAQQATRLDERIHGTRKLTDETGVGRRLRSPDADLIVQTRIIPTCFFLRITHPHGSRTRQLCGFGGCVGRSGHNAQTAEENLLTYDSWTHLAFRHSRSRPAFDGQNLHVNAHAKHTAAHSAATIDFYFFPHATPTQSPPSLPHCACGRPLSGHMPYCTSLAGVCW